jgi:hypothetical protein
MPVRDIAEKELAARLLERDPAIPSDPATVFRRILAIADKAAEEPSVDKRTPEQIIGYDETGLPT